MANNRMYLRHEETGETFKVAKYYPSTGWYVNVATDSEKVKFVDDLNEWLDKHKRDDLSDNGGHYELTTEEGPGMPVMRAIVAAVKARREGA